MHTNVPYVNVYNLVVIVLGVIAYVVKYEQHACMYLLEIYSIIAVMQFVYV